MRPVALPHLALSLALPLLIAGTSGAAAFWERSQWSRCSDAQTAAEWNRYRCWQLEPYHEGVSQFGYGGGIGPRDGMPAWQGRARRGSVVVKRLG